MHVLISLDPTKGCESHGEKPRKSEVFNQHCSSPDVLNRCISISYPLLFVHSRGEKRKFLLLYA